MDAVIEKPRVKDLTDDQLVDEMRERVTRARNEMGYDSDRFKEVMTELRARKLISL